MFEKGAIEMEFSQSGQMRFFDTLMGRKPKDFAEFGEMARCAVEYIAADFGITKVEYRLTLLKKFFPDVKLPLVSAFYEKNSSSSCENEPVIFTYQFANGGAIEFVVYTLKGENALAAEEMWMLEVDFRQLFQIVGEMIGRITRERIILTDLQVDMPNIQALSVFASKLIKSGEAKKYTALYFNIRNFKSVHRSLSYFEGNEVLRRYCKIVTSAVTKQELIARLGGDNFVALILDDNLDYFLDLVQNMVVFYEKNGEVLTFMFGATVGISKITDEKDAGDILMHTNAGYQRAREKKELLGFYDRKVASSIIEKKIILSKFHKALSDREFYVVYQPKVGVSDRKLRGAEVLVRWRHDGGDIMPGSFVSILEEDGCICMLDFFMLEEVCKLLKKVIDEGLEPVKISVNFSKRHLSNNKLVEEIAEVIDRYKVPHNLIEIELTESADSYNQGVMSDVVNELGLLGINTSIDDFGTGYSSLGMLKLLNLNELKIDKSFIPIAPVSDNDRSVLMLKGIINLAKSLGLTIVAEGVETNAQFELIERLGCDIVQGFIFDKPLSEGEFIGRIKQMDYALG